MIEYGNILSYNLKQIFKRGGNEENHYVGNGFSDDDCIYLSMLDRDSGSVPVGKKTIWSDTEGLQKNCRLCDRHE